jgi:hypothetical protein
MASTACSMDEMMCTAHRVCRLIALAMGIAIEPTRAPMMATTTKIELSILKPIAAKDNPASALSSETTIIVGGTPTPVSDG